MAFLKVKNRAVSSLSLGMSDNQDFCIVATGEGAKFPTTGDFHITCEDEIMKCTSRSSDTLYVTRAQEGTTAAAHSAGKSVELRVTAGVIENIQALNLTTKGDIVVRGASAPERLGIGSDLDILTVATNTPAWDDFRLVLAKRMPATTYYNWRDIGEFTLTTTGSGSGGVYTLKNYQLATGTTLNSIARLTSDSIFWVAQDYDVTRFEWTTGLSFRVADIAGQEIWFGFMETPAAPTTTQKHVAFYVDTNGDIYATCGNGTSGTQVDTGLNINQNTVYVLLIIYGSSDVKFYIDNVLKATISTNIPSGFSAYMNFYIKTLEAVNKIVWAGLWHLRGTA